MLGLATPGAPAKPPSPLRRRATPSRGSRAPAYVPMLKYFQPKADPDAQLQTKRLDYIHTDACKLLYDMDSLCIENIPAEHEKFPPIAYRANPMYSKLIAAYIHCMALASIGDP